MTYEVKREAADPFDLMCSDCEVHYIEYFEEITEDELRDEHAYCVIEDKYMQEWEKEAMAEQFGWTPTEPDFNKWLQQCIASGYLREVA